MENLETVREVTNNGTIKLRVSILYQLMAIFITGAGFYYMTNNRLANLEDQQKETKTETRTNTTATQDTRERLIRIETVLSEIKDKIKK